MENLLDALVSVLEAVPENPMIPEWIGIQSRGMKQWITMQTARTMVFMILFLNIFMQTLKKNSF